MGNPHPPPIAEKPSSRQPTHQQRTHQSLSHPMQLGSVVKRLRIRTPLPTLTRRANTGYVEASYCLAYVALILPKTWVCCSFLSFGIVCLNVEIQMFAMKVHFPLHFARPCSATCPHADCLSAQKAYREGVDGHGICIFCSKCITCLLLKFSEFLEDFNLCKKAHIVGMQTSHCVTFRSLQHEVSSCRSGRLGTVQCNSEEHLEHFRNLVFTFLSIIPMPYPWGWRHSTTQLERSAVKAANKFFKGPKHFCHWRIEAVGHLKQLVQKLGFGALLNNLASSRSCHAMPMMWKQHWDWVSMVVSISNQLNDIWLWV